MRGRPSPQGDVKLTEAELRALQALALAPVAMCLVPAVAKPGLALVRQALAEYAAKRATAALLEQLGAQGVKFTAENIVAIERIGERIVFLETGTADAGLTHILGRHGAEFAARGIGASQVPDAIMTALRVGAVVGMQGARPIYEFMFNGASSELRLRLGIMASLWERILLVSEEDQMRLRLMPDYDCHPLWEIRANGVRNIAVDDLDISPQLKRELRAWADSYDMTLDREDPASSGFPSDEAKQEFEREGRHLWELLRKELGLEIEVTYFSQTENREIIQ